MRGDDDARIIQTNDKVEEFSVCYPGNETLGLRVFTRIITPVVERTPAPPPHEDAPAGQTMPHGNMRSEGIHAN